MGEHELTRRSLMVAPVLLAALAGCGKAGNSNIGPLGIAHAAPPDPFETFVLPYDKIVFEPWGNLPPGSGQMAMLYGDFNKPGPYLVMMKWESRLVQCAPYVPPPTGFASLFRAHGGSTAEATSCRTTPCPLGRADM